MEQSVDGGAAAAAPAAAAAATPMWIAGLGEGDKDNIVAMITQAVHHYGAGVTPAVKDDITAKFRLEPGQVDEVIAWVYGGTASSAMSSAPDAAAAPPAAAAVGPAPCAAAGPAAAAAAAPVGTAAAPALMGVVQEKQGDRPSFENVLAYLLRCEPQKVLIIDVNNLPAEPALDKPHRNSLYTIAYQIEAVLDVFMLYLCTLWTGTMTEDMYNEMMKKKDGSKVQRGAKIVRATFEMMRENADIIRDALFQFARTYDAANHTNPEEFDQPAVLEAVFMKTTLSKHVESKGRGRPRKRQSSSNALTKETIGNIIVEDVLRKIANAIFSRSATSSQPAFHCMF